MKKSTVSLCRKKDQIVDQIFGQGFDQGLGEGKKKNTVYSTTSHKENTLKTPKKRQKTSKVMTPLTSLNPLNPFQKGLTPHDIL